MTAAGPAVTHATTETCACGDTFACRPGADCWCAELPALPMPEGSARCLCPACLGREISARASR